MVTVGPASGYAVVTKNQTAETDQLFEAIEEAVVPTSQNDG